MRLTTPKTMINDNRINQSSLNLNISNPALFNITTNDVQGEKQDKFQCKDDERNEDTNRRQ